MKIKYRNERIEMLPETDKDEWFCKELHSFIRHTSNEFMSWYGDVEFDGKETSGYVYTFKPRPNTEELK